VSNKSTLEPSDWALKYIGRPWKAGGTKVMGDGADCYGFFSYILSSYYGINSGRINLIKYDYRGIIEAFIQANEFNNWVEVARPTDGDAVIFKLSRRPVHVGLWIITSTDEGVLHCVEDMGVVFTSSNNLRVSPWKIHKHYRHKLRL
jgi:cell wall-associated NlpC family hydrolase